MIKSVIYDKDSRQGATVNSAGGLHVAVQSAPPLEQQKVRPFRQLLTDDGLKTGSGDMRVNGSVTPIDFWVSASTEADRYITFLSFEISDAGAALNEFGNLTALTNGGTIKYSTPAGDILIEEALQSNWDYVRAARGNPAFGNGANSFRANNISGNSEGFIPVIDLREIAPPYGIKLDKSTKQKLTHTVNDNTSPLDSFNCIAYGFERFE